MSFYFSAENEHCHCPCLFLFLIFFVDKAFLKKKPKFRQKPVSNPNGTQNQRKKKRFKTNSDPWRVGTVCLTVRINLEGNSIQLQDDWRYPSVSWYNAWWSITMPIYILHVWKAEQLIGNSKNKQFTKKWHGNY